MPPRQPKLGDRLRAIRNERGKSLRDIEKEFGINSGYLSQLERNEVANPTPTVLQKISKAYGEPLDVLMEWAGYIERGAGGMPLNQQRALSYIPDDISEGELHALRAVLDAMRSGKSATSFGRVHQSDLHLDRAERLEIRATAVGLLKELDADKNSQAVDLDRALEVAKLVKAGAIELSTAQKETLRSRFGHLVDRVLSKLNGVIHLDNNEVFVKQDMHEMKERFVLGHEIGHGVLEAHQISFAYLDDDRRLAPEFADRLERQANQFSVELLAKGDRLRQEFDGSMPSTHELVRLSDQFGISKQATARRVVEESKQECAVAVAYRAHGGRGPINSGRYRFWASPSFENRFCWEGRRRPSEEIIEALRLAALGGSNMPFMTSDTRGRTVEMKAEGIDALYSVIVMFVPQPGRLMTFTSLRHPPVSTNA